MSNTVTTFATHYRVGPQRSTISRPNTPQSQEASPRGETFQRSSAPMEVPYTKMEKKAAHLVSRNEFGPTSRFKNEKMGLGACLGATLATLSLLAAPICPLIPILAYPALIAAGAAGGKEYAMHEVNAKGTEADLLSKFGHQSQAESMEWLIANAPETAQRVQEFL